MLIGKDGDRTEQVLACDGEGLYVVGHTSARHRRANAVGPGVKRLSGGVMNVHLLCSGIEDL
jgi:hypothetical protein